MGRRCNGFAPSVPGSVVALAVAMAPLVAQVATPPPPPPAPAVTLLGEVGIASLPLTESMTVFDAFLAAKVGRSAHREGLVLVRCTSDQVLTLRIDMMRMLETGDTKANVVLRDGDLLFVPSQAMAAKTEIEVVDAMRSDAPADAPSPVVRARLAAWRLLVEKDAPRRQALVEQFGACGAHGACVVAPLAAALAGDAGIARAAATALGMIGATAAPALDALRRHADSKDVQLAARCKAAIRAIEAARDAAAKVLAPQGEAKAK